MTPSRPLAHAARALVVAALFVWLTPLASSAEPDARTGFVGVSPGHWLGELSEPDLDRDLDLVASLGAGWIRLDVPWEAIEPSRGVFDWSGTDRVVRAARRHGLEVVGILAYTPPWARSPGTSHRAPPTDPAGFARFAGSAAARYAVDGVHAWEIWNEPNDGAYWVPAPDPAAYGALFDAAAGAIRRADPAAVVVLGALAPAVDGDDELSPLTFLRGVYDAGHGDGAAAVSLHPYTFPASPWEAQPWNAFDQTLDLRALMDERGHGWARIWLSEYGAPTGTGPRAVSEASQAGLIDDGLRRAASWPWVERIFLYSHRDVPGGSPASWPDNFGLFRTDRSAKPAVDVVRRFVTSG